MRTFSEFEKNILRCIVNIRKKDDFQYYDIASIIRSELDVLAIEWNIPKEDTGRYYIKIHTLSEGNLKKEMHHIFDIINLFNYLTTNGWVLLIDNKAKDTTYPRFLYDKETCDLVDGEVVSKSATIKLFGKEWSIQGYSPTDTEFINGKVSNMLDKLASSYVYPTSILIDFLENDFQTVEERLHKEQMQEARTQTKWAIGAFIISVIALIVSTTMETTISKEQLQKIIDQVDKIENVKLPSVIDTHIINDTLKVDIIRTKHKPCHTTKKVCHNESNETVSEKIDSD